MCLECDGYSHEEAMQALDLQIRVHGWALVQVEDGPTNWCYTVGLIENLGHPELVLFDVRTDSQRPVIDHLVDLITSHGELPAASLAAMGLRCGDVHDDHLVDLITSHGELPAASLAAMGLRCGDVHDDHLVGDLFGTWANRYGELPQTGDMIHVRLPDSAYCSCHATTVRRLDLPGPLPPPVAPRPAPNRAERRRRGNRGRAA